MSHPADSVVSVLNKEKGSTATQVLKKLGPKGTSCLFMKISVHCASVFHNTLLRSTSGEFLRFCRVLSLGAAASGRRLPAALRLFSWRCLSHWRVRSVYLLTQNPLCPDPSQENARAEQLESGQTIIRVDHSKCPEWIGKWTVVFFRCVEGTRRPYHHDRYPDGPAVVHLRLREGLLPPAPPSSPRDARVPQKEARPHRVNR